MRSLAPFVFAFVALVLAAVYLANTDPITGAVAEAHASATTGAVNKDILSEAFALIFHITTTGIVVTCFSWLVLEGPKIYRRWWSNKVTNRNWKPGPNAQFQQHQAPRMPKISRDDLLWMYLANQGRVPNWGRRQTPPRSVHQQEEDDEINLEF